MFSIKHNFAIIHGRNMPVTVEIRYSDNDTSGEGGDCGSQS